MFICTTSRESEFLSVYGDFAIFYFILFFVGCDVKDFGDVSYEQIDGLTVENMTALGHIAACQKEVNILVVVYVERGTKQNSNVCKIYMYRLVSEYNSGLIYLDTIS
jgi:hypothetical protein